MIAQLSLSKSKNCVEDLELRIRNINSTGNLLRRISRLQTAFVLMYIRKSVYKSIYGELKLDVHYVAG